MNAAIGPFAGLPFFPMSAGYSPYFQTGQMSPMMMNDPRYMISMYTQWNGAQPMGYSYLPPMGLSAIQNNMISNAAGAAWF
jgi:hypothetical protein